MRKFNIDYVDIIEGQQSKINRKRWRKPTKSTSLANISKSVLTNLSIERSSNSNDTKCFIPFHNERDGLNRLIKNNEKRLSKSFTNEKSNNSSKVCFRRRKMLLKLPTTENTPSVGSYNVTPCWIKQSFLNKGFFHKSVIKHTQSIKDFKKEKATINEPATDKKNKIDLPIPKLKPKISARKKGIWEDLTIYSIINEIQNVSISDAKKIADAYDSNIKSCIHKMRGELSSLQKYLK